MRLVHDGENTPPATNELMSRDPFDLEAFGRWGDVVEGDVERRGLGRKGVEHVLGEVGWEVFW